MEKVKGSESEEKGKHDKFDVKWYHDQRVKQKKKDCCISKMHNCTVMWPLRHIY